MFFGCDCVYSYGKLLRGLLIYIYIKKTTNIFTYERAIHMYSNLAHNETITILFDGAFPLCFWFYVNAIRSQNTKPTTEQKVQ